ncbi:MAG TPA: hypothetical protein VKA19_03455 [Alphaproteobacteria bacterium]|nr:hypothetical protein [Alphaproteobacteria bacterium]
MSQYASTSIPKPKNWQDFESHTCVLFQCILNDPSTAAHGRSGQAQQGVDVYGRRERREQHWVGVQCKQKGDSQELTKDELEKEVAEAKKFRPRLLELIVVTTAPDDAKIQQVARDITETHEKNGLFSVEVWGWGTLEREITKYKDAINAFHPDLTPWSRNLESLGEENLAIARENRAVAGEQSETQDQILELLHQISASSASAGEPAPDTSSAAEEAIEPVIHSQIDEYRDLLRRGKPRTAKDLFESLKGRVWEAASDRVRFRIATNIGAAQLELGMEDLAAHSFLEAISYDPEDRVGLANVALAYLIKREPEDAVAAAERALERDPNNAAAAGYLISGHIPDASVSDPFSLVSETLHDTPAVLTSAINFLTQRHNADWRWIARQAVERHGDDKQLRRRAAEAVLDVAVSTDYFAIGGAPGSEITIDDVRHAASVLQSLWDETRAAEGERVESALPHNLALALWTVNELQAAGTVLDQALERYADDAELRELRAALYLEAGEPDAVRSLIGDDAERPGETILHAQALVSTEPQRARAVIQRRDFSAAGEDQRLAAEQVVIQSFVEEGLLDQAAAHAEVLVDDHPERIVPLVELAEIQRKRGDEIADPTLTRAVNALGDGSQFPERFMVGKALGDAGRYDEVGTVLRGHVSVGHDGPALRLLVWSYINADRRAAAYELLTGLPGEVASQPPYLRALCAVNANRKDFPAAREALDRYLELQPDDLEMRLRWFQLCLRLNEKDRIEAYLSDDVEELAGPPELRIELAHWLNQFGFEQRALKLAYDVFLYNSTSPQVHLRYMGLMLPPGRTTSIPLEPATIKEDVAFGIDDGQGGRPWFVIEPDAALRRDETYISPENDIAQQARGLGVGDTIEWGGHRTAWTVVGVKHKYLYALHRSMENFERHFPTTQGLRHVSIDTEDEEPFEEVFEHIKERHDHVQSVFDVLDNNQIPIHVAANALGGDIIEARYGLRETGRTHRVCVGTHPERMQAVEALQDNAEGGCIIDALTLNVIRRLGIENAVREVCGPIGVTGSTRDLYWSRLEEMKAAAGPSMTLYWHDGQIFRHEASKAEWSAALQVREADLNWIDENATIVPAEGSVDPPRDLRELNESIGQNFVDDMLAAEGSGRVLLCEDQVYRALAGQSLGVRGSWLQPLLMLARDEYSLSSDEYNEALEAFVDLGDRYISIDSGLLLAAAQHAENPLGRFGRVAAMLGGADADILSHIRVAVNFLGVRWSERPNELMTAKQTSILLENLIRGRSEWRDVVGLLRLLFQLRFGQNADLDRHIMLWLQGHFLVPFDTTALPLPASEVVYESVAYPLSKSITSL